MTNNSKGTILRVALDAMGGDHGPATTVPGALAAIAAHPGLRIALVGDPDAVNSELSRHPTAGDAIQVVPSVGKVADDEHPVAALRRKPNSSIAVATRLLRIGEADMVVSMGSTGASMATAVMGIGLMDGLERPCIGGNFLGLAPNTTVVDLGSNVDCRPALLLSFAALGVAFSRRLLNIDNPRVGLLSVGEEAAKGNRQVQESHTLFSQSHLNFVGNVEGMDFFTDRADVIVCDGFVGNILIKFAEGLGSVLRPYLQRHLSAMLPEDQLGRVADALWDTTNRPRTMGGPLFGVNGLVMIGHGSSTTEGIAGAIDTGILCHRIDLVEGFRQELSELRRTGVLET
jgi:glycerol-3-phosphate acyltransferase PlsX